MPRPAPILLALLAAAAVPAVASAAPPAPTRASLAKTFEANVGAVVQVIGPKRSGAGVVVGQDGHVLTSVDFVGLYEAKVRIGEVDHPGKVVMADAFLRVALVKIVPPPGLRAAAVRLEDSSRRGDTLLAIQHRRSRPPAPATVRVVRAASPARAFLQLDAALPPGTPLFDPKDRDLVAIAVGRTRALPIRSAKLLIDAQAQGSPP